MMNRRQMIAALAVSPLLATQAVAQPSRIYAQDGCAINGFDPVAYFTKGIATTGTRDHMVMWHGAVWQFESVAHQELFERNPAAYAPRYGGYCAYSMAQRALSTADPIAWAIHDHKLYLTNSLKIRDLWTGDMTQNIALADQNWADNVLTSG